MNISTAISIKADNMFNAQKKQLIEGLYRRDVFIGGGKKDAKKSAVKLLGVHPSGAKEIYVPRDTNETFTSS